MTTTPARGADTGLVLLALAGFASMASMRICDAMLPAIARDFGVSAPDASGAISAFAIGYGVMQLVFGPLADRVGKPQVISLATLACGLGAFAAAAAGTLPGLVLARGLMGAAAGGIVPLTLAWVGDRVPFEERHGVLARLLTYTVGGQMTGTWGGGVLAELLGWRWAFAVLGGGFLVVGAIACLRFGVRGAAAGGPQAPLRSRLATLLADGWVRRIYAVALVEGALVFGVMAFVPTVLHELHGLSLPAAGGIVALFAAGGVLFSRLSRPLLARLPRHRVPFVGGCVVALCLAALAALPHWAWALPACLLAGFGFYMLHSTLQTTATQLSETARGTAMAIFASMLFVGQSAGVTLGAWFAERHWHAWHAAGAAVAMLGLSVYFSGALRRGGGS